MTLDKPSLHHPGIVEWSMKTEKLPDLLSQLEDLNRQALDEFSRLRSWALAAL
jgi:hypothetical protein